LGPQGERDNSNPYRGPRPTKRKSVDLPISLAQTPDPRAVPGLVVITIAPVAESEALLASAKPVYPVVATDRETISLHFS
jgi:hypothetical protein